MTTWSLKDDNMVARAGAIFVVLGVVIALSACCKSPNETEGRR
jgi:hypothetical protein